MKLEYIVKSDDENKTIKDILLSKFNISRRLLITLKKQNAIFLNSNSIYINKTVFKGDKIVVSFSYAEDNSNIVPKNIPLDIIYEDGWYLVINKQAGIPVHPSILHYEDSLSNGVKYYFDTIGLKKKIRPVNRIDKDTSGLVVFAKNEYIQEALIREMKDNKFYKEYLAITQGYFDDKNGIIDSPISRKQGSIIERCIDSNGEPAITKYEVLKELTINNEKISVVKCILKTGKTHQIRVHMSFLNHSLIGDELYGDKTDLINRQALHSYKISFIHPITNTLVNYIAPIPKDLNNIISKKGCSN